MLLLGFWFCRNHIVAQKRNAIAFFAAALMLVVFPKA